MKARMFLILTVACQLSASSVWAEADTPRRSGALLPWHVIAEKLAEGTRFCSMLCLQEKGAKSGQCQDYAIATNMNILKLPARVINEQEHEKASLDISRWQGGQWIDASTVHVKLDNNVLAIDAGVLTEGFYRLLLTTQGQSHAAGSSVFYAIVTDKWKKDLLAFCRGTREQIETNPDPQLIYSSIAASHFNYVMELATQAPVLTYDIIEALSRAVASKQVFDEGKCPSLIRGLTKLRLKRFEGAKTAAFAISLPQGYDDSEKYPMQLWPGQPGPESWDYSNDTGMVLLWWSFPPVDVGYEWGDYAEILSVLKDKINIDFDRVYITGGCHDGIAVIDLALRYPDQWAECSSTLGNASRHLASNALNLPLIFVRAGTHHDSEDIKRYYDFAVKCFLYRNCRRFRHSHTQTIPEARGALTPTEKRDLAPQRVFFTIDSLSNPKAYWVRIDGREDENFIASLDATVSGQIILVKTQNVDAYTLDLALAPVDHGSPVEIIENGNSLGSVTGPAFIHRAEKYEKAVNVKDQFLHGPVSHVFSDAYVVTWLSTGESKDINKNVAETLAGSGPCYEEANMPTAFVATHNIVLVGRPQESNLFADVASALPVSFQDNKVIAGDSVYEGEIGLILIYPNPLNPKRYLAVFSGTSLTAMNSIADAWEQMQNNKDVGIFRVTENNHIEWLRLEKFNTVWGWHEEWGVPLAKLSKPHPKWRWRQWVARVLRKQLGADIAISEDMFVSSELPVLGEITLRELAKVFRNNWIVKIRAKGKDVRKVLAARRTLDSSAIRIRAPVIDGVRLGRRPSDPAEDTLYIDELKNEQWYTVALPYKAINGDRMGAIFKDYSIEADGFLLPLMREYLRGKRDSDLDVELKSIEPGIF